jgi:hypothetical protein
MAKLKQVSGSRASRKGMIKDTGRSGSEEVRDFLRALGGQGVAFGFGDEIEAGIRTGGGLLGDYGATVDQIRDEIDEYRSDRPIVAYGSEIVGSIPSALAGGAGLARLGVTGVGKVGAALGGLSGAGSAEGGIEERALGTAIGAAAGGALSKAAPAVSEEAKKLIKKGVDLTPGQAFGGAINKAEELAQSLPFAGDAITAARNRAKLDFDRVVADEVLQPMKSAGVKVDIDLKGKTGTELFEETASAVDAGYKKLLPELDLPNKKDLVGTFDDVVLSEADTLTKKQSDQFLEFIDRRVYSKMGDGAAISGDDFKAAQSELRKKARNFMASSDPEQRELGEAFQNAALALGQVLKSKNPSQKKALDGLDRSFRRLLPVQTAVVAAKDGGEFTANQLLTAIRQSDKSLRKGDFARGKADMQDLAVAAQNVVPSKVPNSGSVERLIGTGLFTGASFINPVVALPAGATLGAAYQQPINRFTRRAATAALPNIRLLAPEAGGSAVGLLGDIQR